MRVTVRYLQYNLFRVTVASLDEQLQIKRTMTTGLKQLTCTRNEELQLLSFDKEIEFPILVSVNLLLTSPADIDAACKPVVENETKL